MRTARQKWLNIFLIYLGNVEAQIFFLNVFIEAWEVIFLAAC